MITPAREVASRRVLGQQDLTGAALRLWQHLAEQLGPTMPSRPWCLSLTVHPDCRMLFRTFHSSRQLPHDR
jgi:hypothetical protein